MNLFLNAFSDEIFRSTFEITELFNSNSATITIKSELNRTIHSFYEVRKIRTFRVQWLDNFFLLKQFTITAYDEGIPEALQSNAKLRINVRFEKKQTPYFAEKNQELPFLGNRAL